MIPTPLYNLMLEAAGLGQLLTPDRIIAYSVALLAIAGNVTQYLRERQREKREASKEISETDRLTIDSLKRLYETQGLELSVTVTGRDKLQKELEAVSGEYRTLVGIDMQYILDLAREGMLTDNATLRRQVASLGRRLDRYEPGAWAQATGGPPGATPPESGEWRVK